MGIATVWRSMASGDGAVPGGRLLALLLAPVACLYAAVTNVRAALYRWGLLRSNRLPKPVISVGNITVGGTGKTPVTAWIAHYLQEAGLRVAILSRGYGGNREGQTAIVSDGRNLLLTPDQCGDEPYLLARQAPGVMVVIGPDRYRAGLLALEQLNPDVFLLDDGFQHIRLQRDLNIVLLDCRRPFGNGWTLPAGLLREPLAALKRADLVIFTRCRPEQAAPALPVAGCRAEHRLSSFQLLATGDEISPEELRNGRLAASAGIADPAAFFRGLELLGLPLLRTLALADHEPYGTDTLGRVGGMLEEAAVDWLITTEKDGVKLLSAPGAWLGRIVIARLEIVFEDQLPLCSAIDKILSIRR